MNSPEPGGISTFVYTASALAAAVMMYLASIAASIAVARSRKSVLRSMVEAEHSGAERASTLVDQADYYLLCAQFGRVVSSIAVGVLLAFLSYIVAHGFAPRPVAGLGSVWGLVTCVLYATAVAVLLVVVQVIKSIAFEMPEKILCYTALPLWMFAAVCGPVLSFADRLISKVLAWCGFDSTNERELRISLAELGEIVKTSAEAGTLESEEGHILEGVAELSERTAWDVMTPRNQIVWVKETCSSSQVIDVCRKESVSRLLVCGEELDDVKGVLLTKDLLAFAGELVEAESWRKFIRPAFSIPDTKIVKELLVELRQRQIHLSVVLNEHGEVVGVVTLEDLVEELVGEIFDEFDNPQKELPAIRDEAGVFFLDGSVPIDTLYERVGQREIDSESQTVAGFVQEQLGRLPSVGDAFSVDGVTFTVLEAQKNQIGRLSVTRCEDFRPKRSPDIAVGER